MVQRVGNIRNGAIVAAGSAERGRSARGYHPITTIEFPILAETVEDVWRCPRYPVWSVRLNCAQDLSVGKIAKPMSAPLTIGVLEHEGLIAPLAKEKFQRRFPRI
jgi:hypothetical protein